MIRNDWTEPNNVWNINKIKTSHTISTDTSGKNWLKVRKVTNRSFLINTYYYLFFTIYSSFIQ